MARRWICKKACFWKKRRWDPNSRLTKDRLYVGDEQPPQNCFEELGNKPLPAMPGDNASITALSEMLPKTPEVKERNEAPGNVPVVDGQPVDTGVLG